MKDKYLNVIVTNLIVFFLFFSFSNCGFRIQSSYDDMEERKYIEISWFKKTKSVEEKAAKKTKTVSITEMVEMDPPTSLWLLDRSNRVTVLDQYGNALSQFGDFNVRQKVGAPRQLTVAHDGSFAIILSDIENNVSRVDREGNVSWTLDVWCGSVALSENDSLVYATARTEDKEYFILRIDAKTGGVLGQQNMDYKGFDIAVDDKHDAVWVAGYEKMSLLNMKLDTLFHIQPAGWFLVSIDYDANGNAWVAEREYTADGVGENRLLKVDRNGAIVNKIHLVFAPFCVRVGHKYDEIWMAGTAGVKKFLFEEGKMEPTAYHISNKRVHSMVINQRDGSAWMGEYKGGVVGYDRWGNELLKVGDFQQEDKYIGIPQR